MRHWRLAAKELGQERLEEKLCVKAARNWTYHEECVWNCANLYLAVVRVIMVIDVSNF